MVGLAMMGGVTGTLSTGWGLGSGGGGLRGGWEGGRVVGAGSTGKPLMGSCDNGPLVDGGTMEAMDIGVDGGIICPNLAIGGDINGGDIGVGDIGVGDMVNPFERLDGGDVGAKLPMPLVWGCVMLKPFM